MSVNNEQLHKELELIQGVIRNMSANSFEVKKWLIGVLTALLIFKSEELLGGKTRLVWLLSIPITCFWYLDAYYLSTERFYREMYGWVVDNRAKTDLYLYDLKTSKRRTKEQGPETDLRKPSTGIFASAFSKTVWPFYLLPVIFICIYMFSR